MSRQDSFFPIFLRLEDKKILIVGGGKIAKDKLSKCLDFSCDIKLIAKDFSDEILELIVKNSLTYEVKEFEDKDVDNFDIVIVAVDDINVQKHIYMLCRDRKTLVNSVDSREYCDFIFGSYIKKDELVVAISTSGVSPAFSKYLRRFLEKTLPKNIESFLKEMKLLREKLPKGKERMELLEKKCKKFFDLVQ